MKKWGRAILIIIPLLIMVGVSAIFLTLHYKASQHEKSMNAYLEQKYNKPFTLEHVHYNPLSETYVGFGHPADNPKITFEITQIYGKDKEYEDKYPYAYWEDQVKREVTDGVKQIFGDEAVIEASVQVNEIRPINIHIPLLDYKDVQSPDLLFIVEVNLNKTWSESMAPDNQSKMEKLRDYCKQKRVPLAASITYGNSKNFYITPDGSIVSKPQK